MLLWIRENVGTIIVAIMMLSMVSAIIASLIRRKKAGKCLACNYCDHAKTSSACSSSCSGCNSSCGGSCSSNCAKK